MKSNKPLLTISLLISNRPDTVPRCLDSLRPIMEAIPSELILIDTSKSEEMHQLLLTYTDQVYEFGWCHDFAKARNEGIKRAKGKWFLYLDDDEWFEGADALIAFFETNEYKNFGAVNMQIRNFSNPEFTKYSDSWVTRLFRLEDGTCFMGKVHEYLCNLKGTQLFLPEMIYHSGYAFKSQEEKRVHYERNAKLLLDLVEKEPDVLRWQAQMVQEYYVMDDWNAIVDFCPNRLVKEVPVNNFMDKNHICSLYAGLVDAFFNLEKEEEFQEWCEKALCDERSTEVLKAYIYLRKAEKAINIRDDLEQARTLVDKYFEYYKLYQDNELEMREQTGALLINRTFEKGYMFTAHNILIYIALRSGNMEVLVECAERLKSEEGFALGAKLVNYIVEQIATTDFRQEYIEIVKEAVKDELQNNLFCAEAQRWEEKNNEAFLKIAHVYASANSDFWFMHYCRLVDADVYGNKKDLLNALEPMLLAMPNMFYIPDAAYDIIEKHQIEIASCWSKLAGEKWRFLVKEFVDNCNQDCIDRVGKLLCKTYAPADYRMIDFKVSILEKQLVSGPEEKLLDYYEALKQYGMAKLQQYKNYQVDSEEIPADVIAAVNINEYIESEEENGIRALGKIKEAAGVCPIFADGFRRYIHRYIELEEERKQLQNNEMNMLREQVLGQVYSLISNGQKEAAEQILLQLKVMFPADAQIEKLIQEVQ